MRNDDLLHNFLRVALCESSAPAERDMACRKLHAEFAKLGKTSDDLQFSASALAEMEARIALREIHRQVVESKDSQIAQLQKEDARQMAEIAYLKKLNARYRSDVRRAESKIKPEAPPPPVAQPAKPMSGAELRAALVTISWSIRQLGRAVGTSEATCRNWITERYPVPANVAARVRTLVAAHITPTGP